MSEVTTELSLLPDINKSKSENVLLPTEPEGFRRVEGVPPQESFSQDIKHMILVPIRAELKNYNLYNFLKQLNDQKGLEGKKLGLILFINDKDKDSKEIKAEDHLITDYISAIKAHDTTFLDQLNIPEKYRSLARKIIEKNIIEIRLDHLQNNLKQTHYGRLRLHALNLAKAFKNTNLQDDQIILHPSDIDVTYSLSHFKNLIDFFQNSQHCVNFANEEYLPGVHEEPNKNDVTRDLLQYIDEYRLTVEEARIHYSLENYRVLGTPLVSARMSELVTDGIINRKVVENLNSLEYNEDFWFAQFLNGEQSAKGMEQAHQAIGNIGEVFRLNRARTKFPLRGKSRTDAEEAYSVIRKIAYAKKYSEDKDFNFDSQIREIESSTNFIYNKLHGLLSNPQDFRNTQDYINILAQEDKSEHAKIRLRKMRLLRFIDSLAGNKVLSETEEKIIDPYERYFENEKETILQMLREGRKTDDIAAKYFQEYNSFFNPNDHIHAQIARFKALKRFLYTHPELYTG